MPTLPAATTTLDDQAGTIASGLDYCAIVGAVGSNADTTPRVYTSPSALLSQHGYADAVDYAAMHMTETRKPVIFIGLPIVTAGVISQEDMSAVIGTSVISVAAGTLGCLSKTQGVLTVITGGIVGTDSIWFSLSLDGGKTSKRCRLGTATSYTIPDMGQIINFAAGTLVAADVFTWRTSAGRWDATGLGNARDALATQSKAVRSWMIVGDCLVKQDADDILTEVNGYATENDRFVYARGQARAPHAAAKMARRRRAMTGNPSLTFAEVGAVGDTIVRSAGSWIADGFVTGDYIVVAGTILNNITTLQSITVTNPTTLTLGTDDLATEVAAGARVYAMHPLTFAEVGATGDTITRDVLDGSWIADGFHTGQLITIDGTAANDMTTTVGLANVTATVLTLDTDDLTPEVLGSHGVSISAVAETDTLWVASIDGVMTAVDDEPRLDLGAGEAAKLSPLTGWRLDRPSSWAASIREYIAKDIHLPTWRKADGALDGWELKDANGITIYHDERISGGLLAARFTCFRSWANGPAGTFIAMSLTRAVEASLLSYTHNMAVANVACNVCQAETENAIGQVLVLNSDGTATRSSLTKLEERVNSALTLALLGDLYGEGPRASKAVWIANTTDILNVPGATLNGTLSLLLNGTLVNIATSVQVITAG